MNGIVKNEDCCDKQIIMNLYPLYLHDLSSFNNESVNDKGLYDFNEISVYWEESKMHPMLIKVDNEIAGFILLTEKPYAKNGTDFCIQEFFILNKFRRKSVGQQAFKQLIQKYKGIYSLLVLKENDIALEFWRTNYRLNDMGFEEGVLEREGITQYYHVFGQ